MDSFLADNVYVKAIANVGAIIGLCIISYQLIIVTVRILRAAYKNNVRAVIASAKRAEVNKARICADDLHLFVAQLAFDGVRLIASIVGIVIGFVSATFSASPILFDKWLLEQTGRDSSSFEHVMVAVSSIYATMMLLVMLYCSLRILRLIRNVRRYRYKFRRQGFFGKLAALELSSSVKPLNDQIQQAV